MRKETIAVITLLLIIVIVLIAVLSFLLYNYQVEVLLLRRFRKLLRRCPPADPCLPPGPTPVVVDALVIFPGQQEAQRQMELHGAELTRVHVDSSTAHDRISHPPYGGADGNMDEGDRAQPQVMHGVPINCRHPLIPDITTSNFTLPRLEGVIYHLRSASAVYGNAEYMARDRNSPAAL